MATAINELETRRQQPVTTPGPVRPQPEPVPSRDAAGEQAAQEAAQVEEYRDLRLKASVGMVLGLTAMVLSMPLMGASAPSGAHYGADPLVSWAMHRTDPALSAVLP